MVAWILFFFIGIPSIIVWIATVIDRARGITSASVSGDDMFAFFELLRLVFELLMYLF
jgi:hypothetical protein